MPSSKDAASHTFLVLCLVGTFAILSSTMSKNPVLRPFAASLQTPEGFWTGLVASASTIPGILVSLPAAALSDTCGRRKVLVAAALIFASAPFLYLFISTWWQLILVRFYHGFATAIFMPVADATVAELFPAKRGERIALFSSATSIGRGAAPFLGGYILFMTDYSYGALYLAVGVAGVTAFVTALLLLAEGECMDAKASSPIKTAQNRRPEWREVAGNPGILRCSFIQTSQYYVFGAVEYFLVGYLKDVVQLDALQIGIVMGCQIGAVILAKPLAGRISDKIGRRTPIIAGSLVSGLPLLAIPFSTQFPLLLLLALVYGLGFAIVTSSTPALVSELAASGRTGTAMGFLSMTMDIGQTVGPLITGMLISTSLGYRGSFSALAVVLALSVVIFTLPRTSRLSSRQSLK